MKKCLAWLCAFVTMLSLCSAVAAQKAPMEDDFELCISETNSDGETNVVTYQLEDLSITVCDADGTVLYDGPAKGNPMSREYSLAERTIEIGEMIYWRPTDEQRGFRTDPGVAVTVSVKTNAKVSKKIGLTDGDDVTVNSKDVEATLYTGEVEYWKFYVENKSSSSFKVKGGSLSWGE